MSALEQLSFNPDGKPPGASALELELEQLEGLS